MIETPVGGSTTVLPTPSAASENVVVLGLASTSFDCTMLDVAGAMRIETPFTTGSPAVKLSKIPQGCLNSRFRYVPSFRATRTSRGVPESSAGASRYVPLVVTVWTSGSQPSWARCQLTWWRVWAAAHDRERVAVLALRAAPTERRANAAGRARERARVVHAEVVAHLVADDA